MQHCRQASACPFNKQVSVSFHPFGKRHHRPIQPNRFDWIAAGRGTTACPAGNSPSIPLIASNGPRFRTNKKNSKSVVRIHVLFSIKQIGKARYRTGSGKILRDGIDMGASHELGNGWTRQTKTALQRFLLPQRWSVGLSLRADSFRCSNRACRTASLRTSSDSLIQTPREFKNSAILSAACSPLRTQAGIPTPRKDLPAISKPGMAATSDSISATRSRCPR